MARIFGDDMKHTVLVFTFGDHYPLYVKNENNDKIKSEMIAHAEELTEV